MMRRMACVLLCLALILVLPCQVLAAEEDGLLEVTVTTQSNLASMSKFDISGLYADNVFYIDADTICHLTGAEIGSISTLSVIFFLHQEQRIIEVSAEGTLTEIAGAKTCTMDIPVVEYSDQIWISAPDILRYMGATVGFGVDETSSTHMMVSMPYTVMDLYAEYMARGGYLFSWDEVDGRILEPDEQLAASAFSTALFSYDANFLIYFYEDYQNEMWKDIHTDALLSVMQTEGEDLLDPYYEGYSLFGDFSNEMDLTFVWIEEMLSAAEDEQFFKHIDDSLKGYYSAAEKLVTAADVLLAVDEDYKTALETAERFYNLTEVQKLLFEDTILRAAENTSLYEQNPVFFDAALKAEQIIDGEIEANELAVRKAVFSLLSRVGTEALGAVNPVFKAYDLALDIIENLPIFEGYLEDDVRLTYAMECEYMALLAHCLLNQDAGQQIQNGAYLGENITYVQKRMKSDMILSLKSSLTAREMLFNMNYWLTDESREYMKKLATWEAELLAEAYSAVAVPIGVADDREEDLTWIANLAGVGKIGEVVTVGGKTYYWRYSPDSYNTYSGLSHWEAENEMICRNEDGSESVIMTLDGYGEFAVTNEWLIYNQTGGGIAMEKLDGTETRFFGHRLQWVSGNGGHIIYTETDGGLYEMSLRTGEIVRLANEGIFVTAHDGIIYYTSGTVGGEYGAITLHSKQPGEAWAHALYQSLEPLYDTKVFLGDALIAQMCFTDEYIYFSYGSVAGSGAYYQGGNIVRMHYDGTDPQVLNKDSELSNGYFADPGLANWYFTVNADGSVSCPDIGWQVDFVHMQEYLTEDGYVYMINQETGLTFPILAPEDYSVLGSARVDIAGEDGTILVEFVEVVGNKVYYLMHHGVRNEEYGGWRIAYVRDGSAFMMKDLSSGQVTVLYSIP